jgi:hypothetical protein
MDSTTSVQSPLSYVAGGEVSQPSTPVLLNFATQGQAADYRAVFVRRKEHAAAGLIYTVQFTADLSVWTSSATTPTRLTSEFSAGTLEAVSVPFPATVPLQSGDSATPKFFRLETSRN